MDLDECFWVYALCGFIYLPEARVFLFQLQNVTFILCHKFLQIILFLISK